MMTLRELARDLAAGRLTSRNLVDNCLAAIASPDNQGDLAFSRLDAESALLAAEGYDKLRAAGGAPAEFSGIPIAVKDLFDVQGQVTTAGSKVLAESTPAAKDAVAVARLRAAGFIIIGRNTMSEFAFSGLGLNATTGNPLSPWDKVHRRVAGGSSSGAAVAVAEGMVPAALGTDTGGSCRIPAAFCGVVGFKPTASSVSRDGAFPLSQTLDSIGPLAGSVECCTIIHSILAGEALQTKPLRPVSSLRFLVPTNVVLEQLDTVVKHRFDTALDHLERAGASVTRAELPEFSKVILLNKKTSLIVAEAFSVHRAMMTTRLSLYDPWISSRIQLGTRTLAVDYIDVLRDRQMLITQMNERLAGFDAALMPTVAVLPPRIEDLADEHAYRLANATVLRNTSLVNFIDGCAVSLPMRGSNQEPIGLSVFGANGSDAQVLSVAASVEKFLVNDQATVAGRPECPHAVPAYQMQMN